MYLVDYSDTLGYINQTVAFPHATVYPTGVFTLSYDVRIINVVVALNTLRSSR